MINKKDARWYIEFHKKDIENSIENKHYTIAKNDAIKFQGIILYAWQLEAISYDEWKSYKIWSMEVQYKCDEEEN